MLKKWLNKDNLIKHTFTLVKGTVLAQIINLAAQPLLRRVFTPEDFGVYALYVAMVSILTVVATGRYEMAILLPKKESEANQLFKLSILVSFVFSLVLLIGILIFNHQLIDFILEKEMVKISSQSTINWLRVSFYLLPIGIFLISLFNTLNFWFTRQKLYNKVVNARLTNSITNISSSAGFGLIGLGSNGVIGGYLIGQFIGSIYFIYLKSKQVVPSSDENYSHLIKQYKDFPTKSLLSSLFNISASQLPLLLIGVHFGAEIVAFYELIIRVLNVPITMVGKSISQVFFQKISEDIRNNKAIGAYVRSFSLKLFVFMAIPMLVIFFFGDWLFAFVFGEEYRISGELAAYFSVFYLVRFVYYSQATLYTAKRKLGIELRQNIFYLSIQITALLIGFYIFDEYNATFKLLALGGLLSYSIFVVSLLKLANKE